MIHDPNPGDPNSNYLPNVRKVLLKCSGTMVEYYS